MPSRALKLVAVALLATLSFLLVPVGLPTTATAQTTPLRHGPIPVGKGMWIWVPSKVNGGDVNAIVNGAVTNGLTHIYVRTGTLRGGFDGGPFLDALLPVAHENGIRVYGWDFPYLDDPAGDVVRALNAIRYTTPTGHRIDGFVPDIETGGEQVALTTERIVAYSSTLRAEVGLGYPLIICVPNPSASRQATYPYAAVMPFYDAVAPMVYWLNRQPDTDVEAALNYFAQYGKPIIPVGQAYDGGFEGGRPGPPPAHEISRFIGAAEANGAVGVSFWSWQHATQEQWDAIATAPQFRMPLVLMAQLRPVDILQLQALLASFGYPIGLTSTWDEPSSNALMQFQLDRGLAPLGMLDQATRNALVAPVAAPLPPGIFD